MKHPRSIYYVSTILLAVLAACAPQATPGNPPPTVAPSEAGNGAAATEPLVPVNLAGPEMKVGSTWLYVDGTTLVAVPAGPFTMGHGGLDNPEHQVTLGDFWMYSTKVTNQQYARCVLAGQCDPPSTADNPGYVEFADLNNPVTGVNYDQAAAYCTFVHGRLPTEAEWEKTARGPDGNIYPWGNSSPSCDLLNMEGCVGDTTPVTKYPSGISYYSALDTEGNAFEWVADYYKADYYINSPSKDPLGPDTGLERSVRSSAFNSGSNQTQAFNRFKTRPEDHRANLGFRCVVEDPTYFAAFCQQVAMYGIAPGGSGGPGQDIVANCPKIGLNVTPGQCDTGQAQVTFSSNAPGAVASINGPGCGPLAGSFPGSKTTVCTVANTQVELNATCQYNSLGPASCPAHYKLDSGSNMCVWDGTTVSGQQCLPGMTYDPAAQCCTTNTPTAGDFPLCQAGSTFVDLGGGKYGCLGNIVAKPNPHLQDVVTLPGACEGSGEPGGGSTCTLTAAACDKSCRPAGGTVTSDCRCQCNTP